MTQQVQCPNCRNSVLIHKEQVGRTIYCTSCGTPLSVPAPIEQSGASSGLDAAATIVSPPVPGEHVRYAGFWIRVVASLVDTVVLLIPTTLANLIIPVVGGLAVWVIYKGLCLANWDGQTVGKRACNIKVVDEDLAHCSHGQAWGRTFAEFISGILLCIGYLMAAFDGRKQSLHDKMVGTLHIYAT